MENCGQNVFFPENFPQFSQRIAPVNEKSGKKNDSNLECSSSINEHKNFESLNITLRQRIYGKQRIHCDVNYFLILRNKKQQQQKKSVAI